MNTLHTIFSLLFLFRAAFTAPADCRCRSPENLSKVEDHLKLATRISAMKMVASLRDLLHQTSQERIYSLDSTRYHIIKDLQSTYGKLVTHTDFTVHFESLIDELKRLLSEDGVPESQRLQKELTDIVEQTLSRLLPSTFLCLSMGECISASSSYVDCMATHSHQWTVHFGKEPEKMIRRLHEAITRHKLVEKRLESLQNTLINAEKSILPNCVERYTNLTQCGECVTDRTAYCRNSCEEVAADCYLGITTEWDENISSLEYLVKDFSDGFYALEKGIHNSLRRLVETTSPLLARDVVNVCGALSERSTPTRAAAVDNAKPAVVPKKTERLVQQLQHYRGHWKRISKNFCSEPSQDNFCWNGTNIVRAMQTIEELPEILKNVRPRPTMDPRIEGSGSPVSWSDDEDLVEGSGSGNGFQEHDSEQPHVSHDIFHPPPSTEGPILSLSSSPVPTPLYVDPVITEIVVGEELKPDSASLTVFTTVLSLLATLWLF